MVLEPSYRYVSRMSGHKMCLPWTKDNQIVFNYRSFFGASPAVQRIQYRRMLERVSEKTDSRVWLVVRCSDWIVTQTSEVSWPILSKTVFLELLVVANLVPRSHSFYSMFFLVVFAVQTRERVGQERVCMTHFRFGFVLKQHLNLRPTFFGQVRLGVWLH